MSLAVFFILFIQCNNLLEKKADSNISVKIDRVYKASDDTLKDLKWESTFYNLDLSLVNNTDSTVNFWMNTCRWNDNFVTNIPNIRIIGPLECTRNFPKVFDLDRKAIMSFRGLISIQDSFDYSRMIRIGFIYIKSNEFGRLSEITLPSPDAIIQANKRSIYKSIIWSEYFTIK